MHIQKKSGGGGGVGRGCIPLHRHIPLGLNSVYILFISSKRLGIFQLNFETLVKLSTKTVLHPCIYSLKYLCKSKSRLLANAYYLRFLTSCEVEAYIRDYSVIISMISSTWPHDVFKKRILVYKLHTVLLLNLLHSNFNFIACWENEIWS